MSSKTINDKVSDFRSMVSTYKAHFGLWEPDYLTEKCREIENSKQKSALWNNFFELRGIFEEANHLCEDIGVEARLCGKWCEGAAERAKNVQSEGVQSGAEKPHCKLWKDFEQKKSDLVVRANRLRIRVELHPPKPEGNQ